jgi:hypothetical protein
MNNLKVGSNRGRYDRSKLRYPSLRMAASIDHSKHPQLSELFESALDLPLCTASTSSIAIALPARMLCPIAAIMPDPRSIQNRRGSLLSVLAAPLAV